MKKLKLYTASSLDGFIATRSGDVDWLTDPDNADSNPNKYGYLDFYNSIDTTLMGYNTYKKILDFKVPFPYPDKRNCIFSKQHEKNEDNPVDFIRADPAEFVSKLMQENGKDIWLIGGGQINSILLSANLIDEIILSIIPVVLTDGLALFSGRTDMKRFIIKDTITFDNSLVQIIFAKK